MDNFQARHLAAWVDNHLPKLSRDEELGAILLLIHEQPDLLDTHSWSEIHRLSLGPMDLPTQILGGTPKRY